MTSSPWQRIAPHLAAHNIVVPAERREAIERYAALLLEWNRRINLTGARTVEELYARHLLDCLMLETVPRPPALRHWVDIGSGAGLPGLLVALLHPECHVTAVETVAKKVTFQEYAARSLGLANHAVLRMDVWRLARSPDGAGRFDGALARAFAGLTPLLELAAALLRPGGELWAMKGDRLAEEQAGVPAALLAPFEPAPRTYAYRFPELEQAGVIAVYRKRDGTT